MRAILVDDEKNILEESREIIGSVPQMEVIKSYTNPFLALDEMDETEPECVFLDIEMPGMNGIELASAMCEKKSGLKVVFLTAFNHYATQAFEQNALDYVLKPIHPDRFEKMIRKLCIQHEAEKQIDEARLKEAERTAFSESVRVRMFGAFEVGKEQKKLRWSRSKAKELFAYLLECPNNKASKYRICEDLWPESGTQNVLISLQTVIYSVRKTLKAFGCEDIQVRYENDSYFLTSGKMEVDVWEFQNLYKRWKLTGEELAAKYAMELYRADYLLCEDWLWARLSSSNLLRKYQEMGNSLILEWAAAGKHKQIVELFTEMINNTLPDPSVQLAFLQASYQEYGLEGMKKHVKAVQRLLENTYGTAFEGEANEYCLRLGIMSK